MKIAFNRLAVEITRKCQLQCAHCMRGDAQNINMDKTSITTLLNKTSDIEYLFFTGGEPTLNIDGMKFFLDTMIKNNIHLATLGIITNGVLLSEQFTDLLKRYYDWIDKSDSPYKWYIKLEVSKDKYHNGVDVKKAIDFYTEQLKDYPKIKIGIWGIADIHLSIEGRAKELPIFNSIQNDIYNLQNIKKKTKIEVLTKNQKTFCPLRKFEQVRDNEARILCPIKITAKGYLIPMYPSEYVEEDDLLNQICNVSGDILYGIHYYNLRFPHCIEFEVIKPNIISKNSKIYSLKKISEIFKHNFNNPDNKISLETLLIEKEKWNKSVDEVNQYFEDKSDYGEISFESTEDEVVEIYNELLELRKKGAAHYLKEKNHRQPTEAEIQNETAKLYQGYGNNKIKIVKPSI